MKEYFKINAQILYFDGTLHSKNTKKIIKDIYNLNSDIEV